MLTTVALADRIQSELGRMLSQVTVAHDEVTIEVCAENLKAVCLKLRDDEGFKFEQLIDLCGVDYLTYGVDEWKAETASASGFSRGVQQEDEREGKRTEQPRFFVVYHLMSVSLNQRLRVRAHAAGEPPHIDSVVDIWASANWYEREAFDLFGILFKGHPDLRRILTDYGFIGHPFRKDFPLIGHVEMRYDAAKGRVVYEPVSIKPRTLVPRIIREDFRYETGEVSSEEEHG